MQTQEQQSGKQAIQDHSEIVVSDHATVITGHDAMLYTSAVTLKAHILLYMKTKIVPTRGVGIKWMLEAAAKITKPAKPYKSNQQGQQQALDRRCLRCWATGSQ